ncbi:MAG: DUF362 domain-containing protein [Desulfobacteraceae bacterium]|nr:MAG: DUF362 domain-containing protein [Desulfobacteraceae bacterium]
MDMIYLEKKPNHTKKIFGRRTFSRRDFLKYTGAIAGLYFAGPLINCPFLAWAGDRPRVISIHDPDATNYDYVTGYHWEYINQNVVNNMMTQGVMALTGKTNRADAWKSLIPYNSGEVIVIKINLNNSRDCDGNLNKINTQVETINAIIDGLTSMGVPGDNIWITDPSRRISDRFQGGISNPYIHYYSKDSCTGANYHSVDYVDPDSPDASVATCPAGEKILPSQVFVEADHLINVPLLKSHGAYVTLALKNHYGSVIYENFTRSEMHAYFNEGKNSAGCDLNKMNILADINNNPHIKDKTRLVIGDGLFGNAHTHWLETRTWEIFGNDDSNLLFFSKDPVAISSVMADYIMAERGWQDHEQLHAAASMGLGVHDHWDSFKSKNYSLIDYIPIDLDNPKVNRLDIDRSIRDLKAGSASEKEVKETITRYMEGI